MSSDIDIAVTNPRTGEIDAYIHPTNAEDMAQTCEYLREGQKKWCALSLQNRIHTLGVFVDKLNAHRQGMIDVLAQDTGRYVLSVMETDGVAASVKRWTAIAMEHDKVTKGQSTALPFIHYEIGSKPLPLVGVISPWNFPLTLALIDAIPALLAGCAVIIKPSEIAPRIARPLRCVLDDIPVLKHVFTVVDGAGETGAALIDNVDAICFTGSVATGRKVGEQAGRNFIPSYLELGGKDPAIVLEGADIERATTALLRGSIINSGQGCQSIERIYVHENIREAFLTNLVNKAERVTLNTDDIHSGHLGPMIDRRQAHIIQNQIDEATAKGAHVLCGGQIVKHGGLWYPPTILSGVTHDMKVMREETFGPVMPVMSFREDEEAISLANDSLFGLSACVFGPDDATAKSLGKQIEAGAISINDAALTALMYEAEKNSFKLSGLGASRMGPSGYARFFRKQSLMTNTANVFTIDQFKEDNTMREDQI